MVKAAGLAARYSTTNVNIIAKLQDNAGSSGYWDSWFIYCNNSIVTYATGVNYGTDAIIQLSFTGTSVVFRIDTNRDGIYDYSHSATVTNTDPGLCGVNAYNQVYFDDFCYDSSCP
jgi:hypothetical protein